MSIPSVGPRCAWTCLTSPRDNLQEVACKSEQKWSISGHRESCQKCQPTLRACAPLSPPTMPALQSFVCTCRGRSGWFTGRKKELLIYLASLHKCPGRYLPFCVCRYAACPGEFTSESHLGAVQGHLQGWWGVESCP
eukprot:353213-Chlamydomonas_euryale.AAC.4